MDTPQPPKSKLLINEPPLQVLPTLARFVGLGEAIVLQQLHYWLQNPKVGVHHNGHKWVRNSIREWQADNFPFWHVNTITRLLDNLQTDELVLRTVELNQAAHDKTWWYAIRYENLNRLQTPTPRILALQKTRQDAPFHHNGGRPDDTPFHHNGGDPSTIMVDASPVPIHHYGGTNIHRENIETKELETTVSLPLQYSLADVLNIGIAQVWERIREELRGAMTAAPWRLYFAQSIPVCLEGNVLIIAPTSPNQAERINYTFPKLLDRAAASLGYPVHVRAREAFEETR